MPMSLPAIEIDGKTFLREHFALPPLPEVSVRIMERINSGQAGAKEVADLLRSDAALVALVFKLVNSAYYSLPFRIERVTQAVAFLGLSEINRLVMALGVMQSLQPEDASDFRRFWKHSFYTALISRSVSRTFFRSFELEGLYSAVLLHDIGKLVYAKFFPRHHAALTEFTATQQCFYSQAEAHYGLPSHQSFGTILCQRWNLPEAVRLACKHHELDQLKEFDPRSDFAEFRLVVGVSNMMAHLAGGCLNRELKEEIFAALQAGLECNRDELLVAMGEVYELQESVSSFLGQL